MIELLRHNSLPTGFKVHWYEIDSILGEGGFGITYLAHDTNLKQQVAIKEFFPSELASRSEDGWVHTTSTRSSEFYDWGLSRFLNEAQTLAQFRHPNIVLVYSVFEANNTAYMVMEYVKGDSLAQAFKNGKLKTEEELLKIVLPLLDGLQVIHKAGFIHRDIKPSNILLRETGQPILLDFGSARQALGVKTRMLTTLVSPGFTPFEQYSDMRETEKQGPWTDLYSLGATLYMAISGKCPADALTRVSAILSGKDDVIIPASVMGKGRYSPRFLNAIDRALAFYPSERPQSIDEFKSLLPSLGKDELKTAMADSTRLKTDVGDAEDTGEDNYIPPAPTRTQTVFQKALEPKESFDETAIKPAHPAASRKKQWFWGFGAITLILMIALAILFQLETRHPSEQGDKRIADEASGAREQEKVQQLLAAAKEDLAAARLTTPRGNNAFERFKAVLKLQPDNKEALLGLNEIVLRYGKLAEAAMMDEQFETAEYYLRKAESILPSTDIVRQGYAQLAKAKAAQKKRERIKQWLTAAEQALKANRLTAPRGDNALERYRAVLEQDPDNAEAKNGLEKIVAEQVKLADRAIAEGKLETAEGYLKEAGQILPNAPIIAQAQQQLAEAKAAQEKRERIDQWLTAAEQALKANRLTAPEGDNALERYRAVLEQDPDNAEAKNGLEKIVAEQVKLADRAIAEGKLETAEGYLKEAGQILPNAPLIAQAQQQLSEAKAAQKKREQIEQWLTAAEQALKANRLTAPRGDNALERYRTVLEQDPDNAEAKKGLEKIAQRYLQFADAAVADSQFERAERFLDTAMSIAPAMKGIDAARSRLADAKAEHQRAELAKQQAAQQKLEEKRKDEQIRALLNAAEKDLAALRLSTPAGNNALERYQAVLELAPGHKQALEGMEKIVDRYVSLAESEIARERFDRAGQYLEKADSILPEAGNVSAAYQNLEEAKGAAEKRLAELEQAKAAQAAKIKAEAASKQEQIRQLLADAERDLAASRLSSPAGNNALERFNAILQLDPGNQAAKEGLEKIVARYVQLAEGALSRNEFGQAESYLKKADGILPRSEPLREARLRLQAVKQSAQQMAAQKEAAKPVRLSELNILGNWCGEVVSLEFNRNSWSFYLKDGHKTTYPIERYEVGDDTIAIYWKNHQGNMITEFGNFKSNSMVQVRGRMITEKQWHNYNRVFKRCP